MPYQDSPGWERQWKTFSWEWDFHVSTVSEGHRVVNDKDKSDAKSKGAKLTFGEVLDCGVLRMLHNLGAAKKSSFHDLGMGPGKMLIQTYLRYDNFKRCMGVELAKGRYDLGERNIRTLLKTGWRGRTFLGVEFKKGEFFKIVEDVPNKTPAAGWKVGDKVVAYYPLLKKDKMTVKDYHGKITEIKKHESGDEKKSTYVIQYDDGTSCDRVQHRYLFIPGTERTCEVWYGSLFDYPGGFDAEMCILETDFPEEMHPQLIQCMTGTPIGCTFLTYHDLKKFSCYDWNQLRQIDCNIYDNDRYITSWSQGWRFYIWEHIRHFHNDPHYVAVNGKWSENLKVNDQILFTTKDDDEMKYGEIVTISSDGADKGGDDEEEQKGSDHEVNLIVKTNRIEAKEMHYESIALSSSDSGVKVFRSRHRFRMGQVVRAYHSDNFKSTQHHTRYQIYKAKIIGVNAKRLSYVVKYMEEHRNKIRLDVSEQYIYTTPKLLFKPKEQVMACWPRNAQNKNCPHRYKRFPAEIMAINNDATYRLRYNVSPYLLSLLRPQTYPEDYHPEEQKKQGAYAPSPEQPYADTVREMWIQYPAEFVLQELLTTEDKVGTPFYMTYQPKMVATWGTPQVLQWLVDIGINEKTQNLFRDKVVEGKMLLQVETKGERECREALQIMLLGKSMQNGDKGSGDSKTESVSVELNDTEDGLGLSRIEMRNLFANIKHLKKQHEALENDLGGNGDIQSFWKTMRDNLARGHNAGPLVDTDTK